MKAKSVMERIEYTKLLDKIALPLILDRHWPVWEAYHRAILECDAQAAERFPATRREPPFRLTSLKR